MYSDYEIRQMPLSEKSNRRKVERFLSANGLQLDEVDYYAGVFTCGQEEIWAGGGLCGDTIKCIAVDESKRDEGLSNRLVSHLVSTAVSTGHPSVKVFTKPGNRTIFESLGFRLITSTPDAIFMENGQRGINAYCQYLQSLRQEGSAGIIVMNANPFTHGHRYLIEQAANQVDHLYVIAVKEDKSQFSYAERLAMIKAGCNDLKDTTVCEGSDYAISASTFPTYFLKKADAATDIHITLDLNIFMQYIAPALNASVRFVGTEPTDALTARYNELMKAMLPSAGIRVTEIERKCLNDAVVSASDVRNYLNGGSLRKAAELVWPTTLPYLLASAATSSLRKELDTTPKPGLVDQQDNGAHQDMDYRLMAASIQTLHPYFIRLATVGCRDELPAAQEIAAIGQEAEKAMLRQTNGINTYKGALFSLGITTVAAAHLYYIGKDFRDIGTLRKGIAYLANQFPTTEGTHGSKVRHQYQVKGALDNACEAYPQLFDEWLPYYHAHIAEEDVLQKTLLCIMSSLEDTNIYFRKGPETAREVKRRSAELLANFSIKALEEMNRDFIRKNISPGGSADMLSLTVFIHSIMY